MQIGKAHDVDKKNMAANQLSTLKPVLDELILKREKRVKEFSAVLSQIARISSEIAGAGVFGNVDDPRLDERDLSVKRLRDLQSQLEEQLEKDKDDESLRKWKEQLGLFISALIESESLLITVRGFKIFWCSTPLEVDPALASALCS
ncbi:65-kDa microtubule-associated protein 5 [Pyrus ussuriensis x Pyrus communis]|uniref:65-kDa microtubule-associated protein 5 n=1 Tax=Pyrus ussuriensis x Pyrus communis TaxID=2448454 RepID=A0A5N5F3E9_9ROSA|nr:65-kDa microtubule-associated protein 5 [Pyrus ussuriensis x Pyrus communis]